MIRRELERIDDRKDMMIAAGHANGNMQKDDLEKFLDSIEETCEQMRQEVLGRLSSTQSEQTTEEVEEFRQDKWW